jgi:hypothetical protein
MAAFQIMCILASVTAALCIVSMVEFKPVYASDVTRPKRSADIHDEPKLTGVESVVQELRVQMQQIQDGRLEEMELLRSSHRHEMAALHKYHKTEMDSVWTHADTMCDRSPDQDTGHQGGKYSRVFGRFR